MDPTARAAARLSEELGSRMSSNTGRAGSTLVASKLAVPPPHRNAIRRHRTELLLTKGTQHRLVLVAAPAGYGKTTLVTSWLASRQTRVGWVSLDSGDDDPARFWSYVIAALVRCGVMIGSPEEILDRHTMLSNALAELDDDVVLVLDDYHCITSAGIHRDVASLIAQHLPRFHLVLLTRSDPPFFRSRWKANGDALELRVRDLAFDDGEMAQFLGDHGVELSAGALSSLLARVEGWPAAMRLVTLWVAGRDDQERAVTEFASSDASVADYLLTEVLASLPDPLRRFLLRTSILGKLTGDLCDAVTGDSDGAENLRRLQRRDLFVQTLDHEHAWVRYHQLFRELLANELGRTEPGAVAGLHRRASAWFTAHGDALEAIRHATLAEDWACVRALMLAESLAIGSRYPPSTVEGWLSALPAQVLQSSPFFQLLRGYLLATMGSISEARQALNRALSMTNPGRTDPDLAELPALVHAILAGIARLECDLPSTLRSSQRVDTELTRLSDDERHLAPMVHGIADTALIGAFFWDGRLAESERLCDAFDARAGDDRLHRMRVNALSSKALMLATCGRLREAAELAPRVLEMADPIGVAGYFQANAAHLALAIVALQHGDRSVARQELVLVMSRAGRHGDRGPFVTAAVLTARMLTEDGELAEALSLLNGARTHWPHWVPPTALEVAISAEEARLALLAGEPRAAQAISARLTGLDDGTDPAVRLARARTQGALLLAAGDVDAAAQTYAIAAEAALTHRLGLAAVDMFTAAAAALAAARPDEANKHLDRALAAAADDGIVAPFLAETDILRPLLLSREGHDEDIRRVGMRRQLLARMGVPGRRSFSEHLSGTPAPVLSDREAVVLRMLRGTLTNAEIASGLAISPNTVKTHVKNIHRKLGATNRQQVVERARELGIQ